MVEKIKPKEFDTNMDSNTFSFGKDTSFLVKSLINLYANKEESVLRELVSNAYDSYDASTPDVEKKVVLILDEQIIIQDFGTGMSPEFMEKKYTEIGFSTKRTDNTKIGAKGLGRMSALSVTPMYTLETCYQGVKYTYSIWYDTNIHIAKIKEEPTDEVGTKIILPRNADYVWKNAVKALEFFPNLNTIIYGNLTVNNPTFVEYEGYRFYHTKSESVVNFGNVLYDIDNFKYEWDGIFKLKIVPYIPLGENVSFTPSRESFIYDSDTVATLKKYFDKLNEWFKKEYSKDFPAFTEETYNHYLEHPEYYNMWGGIDINDLSNSIRAKIWRDRKWYFMEKSLTVYNLFKRIKIVGNKVSVCHRVIDNVELKRGYLTALKEMGVGLEILKPNESTDYWFPLGSSLYEDKEVQNQLRIIQNSLIKSYNFLTQEGLDELIKKHKDRNSENSENLKPKIKILYYSERVQRWIEKREVLHDYSKLYINAPEKAYHFLDKSGYVSPLKSLEHKKLTIIDFDKMQKENIHQYKHLYDRALVESLQLPNLSKEALSILYSLKRSIYDSYILATSISETKSKNVEFQKAFVEMYKGLGGTSQNEVNIKLLESHLEGLKILEIFNHIPYIRSQYGKIAPLVETAFKYYLKSKKVSWDELLTEGTVEITDTNEKSEIVELSETI